jgi:hypothetical protein
LKDGSQDGISEIQDGMWLRGLRRLYGDGKYEVFLG